MESLNFLMAAVFLMMTSYSSATDPMLPRFKKIQLTDKYWSEGANFGDLNRDGHEDVVSGPFWYEGPSFRKRHEFYPARQTFKIKKDNGTEKTIAGFEGALGKENSYSDNFFAFTYDFNHDSWPDILIIGFPGKEASWYENPGTNGIESDRPWNRHLAFDNVDNESPMMIDLGGNGRFVLLCMHGYQIGFVTPNWNHPESRWTFHPISPKGDYTTFTHGIGAGDVNDDGRLDILEANGWWEPPASLADNPVWRFHQLQFALHGSQMFVYDVNGDGLADVITALDAHGYGLAWYEQLRKAETNGEIGFKQHIIINKEPTENRYGVAFSQLHALELIDIDGDGLKDLVTGKRFWAHGSQGDPEPSAPAVLYWFKLARNADKSVEFIPHLIDDNSGIGMQVAAGDINKDHQPDIIVANKKGTFLFLQKARKGNKTK